MSIDRREDAGDFYPGGKVISTRPVATGGDVKHSDFEDLDVKTNTLPDLRAAVKGLAARLGATVVTALAACVAIGATVQTVPINDLDFDANPSIVTNVVFDAPPDFSTNNAALVETIEATAPAPGNYANVSNKAMNAVQQSSLPTFEGEQFPRRSIDIHSDSDDGYISVTPQYMYWSDRVSTIKYGRGWSFGLSDAFWEDMATWVYSPLDAAAATNALQDTAIESNRVDIASNSAAIEGKASKADATLTTGNDWVWDSPAPKYNGENVVLRLLPYPYQDVAPRYGYCWAAFTVSGDQCSVAGEEQTRDDGNSRTSVTVNINGVDYTARRHAIGFVLGSQTDKPLQIAGDYATNADVVHKTGDETIAGNKTFTGGNTVIPFITAGQGAIQIGISGRISQVTAGGLLGDTYVPNYGEVKSTITAAIREQSLGGIWDAELQVWWTPVMRNGSLTYQATTNVNLNAEN